MKRCAPLLLLLLGACGVREDGLTVDVTARVLTPGEGTWVVERVQLFECHSAWRALSPISTAYAHGDGHTDPREIEGVFTVSLGSPETQPLVTFTPPPGDVCGLSVLVTSPQRRVFSFPFEARPLDADHRNLSLHLTLDDDTIELQ